MHNLKIEGKQPRGGPRTRWTDQVRKDIEMKGGKNVNTKQINKNKNRKWENIDE
jgi:hypothetical protein